MAKSAKTAEPTLTITEMRKIQELRDVAQKEDVKFEKAQDKSIAASEALEEAIQNLNSVFWPMLRGLPESTTPKASTPSSSTKERQDFVLKTLEGVGGSMKEEDLRKACADGLRMKRIPRLGKIEGVSLDDGVVTLKQ